MEKEEDTYRTILKASTEVLYKDRKSKFYGYAFPIMDASEVKPIVEKLRKMHSSANHVCYAWQVGITQPNFRANDDGEPNNSAGMPIYGQIQSFKITNVLIAVVRIFGGTKLGVGGLIQAYKTTAHMALEASNIIEKIVKITLRLTFPYSELAKVMRLIKQKQLQILMQKMDINCEIHIGVRRRDITNTLEILHQLHKVKIKRLN